jgi:predicted DNA binding CopG/RHH family protein
MDRRITVRLDRQLADWIANQGKKEGVTMAGLVRRLLEANMALSKPDRDPKVGSPDRHA